MARKQYNGIYYDDQTDYQKLINGTSDNQKKAVYEQKRNAKIKGGGMNYATTNDYAQYLPGNNTPYNIDTDYSTIAQQLWESGNLTGAYNANQQRNSKIDNEALDYSKNTFYDQFNPETRFGFSGSDNLKEQKDYVNSTFGDIMSFRPYDYKQDAELQALLGKRTGLDEAFDNLTPYDYRQDADASYYADAMKSLMDRALNYGEFSYNLESDPMYQQYKDQYTTLGNEAMTDTMAQAASLTGGYGSTYSQGAGQQAYEHYLGRLNDVVPELYAQAYERYMGGLSNLLNSFATANTGLGTTATLGQQSWENQVNLLAQRWNMNDQEIQELYNMGREMSQDQQNALLNQFNAAQSVYNTDYGNEFNEWAARMELQNADEEKQYNRGIYADETAYNRQKDAQALVMQMIQAGMSPTDEQLAAAGFSREQANEMFSYLASFDSGSGGSGSGGRSGGRGRSYGGSGGYGYTPEASGTSEEYVSGNGTYKAVSSAGGKDVTSGFKDTLKANETSYWNQISGYANSGKKTKSELLAMVKGWESSGKISSEMAARMIYTYGLNKTNNNAQNKMSDGRQKS